MNNCMYTAQGEMVCKEHFIRSGTREPLIEKFAGTVNTRPNESKTNDQVFTPEIIKKAIENGCSISYDKQKGYNISNCTTKPFGSS